LVVLKQVSDDVTVEDGLSLYKLNDKGYVCEHIVIRVMPPKPKKLAHVFSWMRSLFPSPVPAGASRCDVELLGDTVAPLDASPKKNNNI